MICSSPVDSFLYKNRQIYVKRDDLISVSDSNGDSMIGLSGNKVRKLQYFLETNLPNITKVISYGGTQSNMMLALSALAQLKGWSFDYYCHKISQMANNSINSNLALARANGMQTIEVVGEQATDANIFNHSSDTLIIAQGGAEETSRLGMQQLADELRQFAKNNNWQEMGVFVPSGTGTTALYLQEFLSEFTVYTTNCVGSADYLRMQWQKLKPLGKLPIIFPNTKFRFATPNPQLWQMYERIHQHSNIEFDLVYDPVGWHVLDANLDMIAMPLVYLHCGGTSGNGSMQARYQKL